MGTFIGERLLNEMTSRPILVVDSLIKVMSLALHARKTVSISATHVSWTYSEACVNSEPILNSTIPL